MRTIKLFENKKVLLIYIICNAITFIVLISCIVSAILQNTYGIMVERIALCMFAFVIYNMPLILRMKYKLHIPAFLQITVTIFAIAHFVFGEIQRAYDHSIVFDKLLHTASGVIFGICGFSLINGLNNTEKPLFKLSPFFVAVFSFCFALAIGYVWELFEFTADSLFGVNMQRWQDSVQTVIIDGEEHLINDYGQGSGLIDSMVDMFVNLVGAAVIAIIGFIWLKKKSNKMDSILIKTISTFEHSKANADVAAYENNTANINTAESDTPSGGTQN